jgi:hypothetical protein
LDQKLINDYNSFLYKKIPYPVSGLCAVVFWSFGQHWLIPKCCNFCLACPNGLKIGSEIN